jgi:hypothetical protein
MLAGPSFNRLNHWSPQSPQNMLGIHRALVPVMTGASLEAPQYDLPDLRGKQRTQR